jgi:hypothetical protein
MDFQLITKVLKAKYFRLIIFLGVLYFIGWGIFMVWISPDTSKNPAQPGMWFRNILWILYWRWYLDWPMIFGCILILFVMIFVLHWLKRIVSKDRLTIYVVPFLVMLANYFGMVIIDIAVTAFADVNINGTWETTITYIWGLTPQRLYHGFFFWFMPVLIIVGLPLVVFVQRDRYIVTLRTFCTSMCGYLWTLGLIDPWVSQAIWNDWRIFGTWNMMGFDAMWAEGWIVHYLILGFIMLIGNWFLQRIYMENISK